MAKGSASAEVVEAAQKELADLLHLRECRFEAAPFTNLLGAPTLERQGVISGSRYRATRQGDLELELLERAVANVVDNAIRHSPPGTRVRLEAGVFDGRVDVRIVDQGPGIPPRRRDLVFQPFQRLNDTGGGTGVGLGLAVARGFLQAMGGPSRSRTPPAAGRPSSSASAPPVSVGRCPTAAPGSPSSPGSSGG